jgi:hypothetical protein
MEPHRFEASPRGELLHFTNEQLRATVPPEGMEEYCRLWPMAEDLCRQLVRSARDAKATAAAAAATAHAGTRAQVLAELQAAGFTVTPPAPKP